MLGSNRLEDRLASAVSWSKICIHRESFAFSASSNFNCNVHQYSLDGNISAESFPFLPEIFFVKDCIGELSTRFVVAGPWEINSSNTTALHACCTFRRVRNRFQPQTSLWNYEKTMLIKIVAMFRNLLISSFDVTIRVKRVFHPAPASRGFASYVFLVLIMVSVHLDAALSYNKNLKMAVTFQEQQLAIFTDASCSL